MTNEEFIQLHRHEETRSLALRQIPDGVDAKYCLQQIDGWQTACRKLPRWASTEGLLYPPRLAMEQCSSEPTARYKRDVVMRLLRADGGGCRSMADLTGGFGVDFSYLAPCFEEAFYVEQREELCALALHNFPLLGLPHARVVCAETRASLPLLQHRFSFLFLDPARRSASGRKVVSIEDCSPDIAMLHDILMQASPVVMVKLSPMLDIASALKALPATSEIHVVSVEGECKELLLLLRRGEGQTIHCVNLCSADPDIVLPLASTDEAACLCGTAFDGACLYEPNASILKAGVQNALCKLYSVEKLHPHSHLFVGRNPIPHFPGRTFRICGHSDFSKRGIKQLLGNLKQANITLRNFPSTTAELRNKLHLREGGDTYLFATTLCNGAHVLLRCEKIPRPDTMA